LLKTQNEFQSTVIGGLVKQTFLAFFVLSLSCAAFLNAAHSASELPDSGQSAEKQLLQRITALERSLEAESQAIEALDVRIAQIESQYLAVKSGIEQSTAAYSGFVDGGQSSRVSAVTAAAPVRPLSVVVTPDDDPGTLFERSMASFPVLNAGGLLAAGGFLAVLLLLTLQLYRRKRELAGVATDITDSTETVHFVKQDQASKKYLQSLQQLAALKKAAQGDGPSAEPVTVIRRDSYKQKPLSDKSTQSMIADIRVFLRVGQSARAIQLLESFLARNSNSEAGWQLLFRILHHQHKKAAFRKYALRFRRLERFPQTWRRIQSWGHALEPSEPLYMNVQEKRRRFFSG
jgi:hypothetical protein